jgi:hypothetical protein
MAVIVAKDPASLTRPTAAVRKVLDMDLLATFVKIPSMQMSLLTQMNAQYRIKQGLAMGDVMLASRSTILQHAIGTVGIVVNKLVMKDTLTLIAEILPILLIVKILT